MLDALPDQAQWQGMQFASADLRTPRGRGFLLFMAALGLVLWLVLIVHAGLLDPNLWETYDAAGTSLQVEQNWANSWYSGHHTNTGVRHPGPAFLFLVLAGTGISAASGGLVAPLGAQVALLSLVKVGCVVGAATLVGRALRSWTAGPLFLLVLASVSLLGPWDGQDLSWSAWGLLDFAGRGLQTPGASLTLLALAAAFAWVRRDPVASIALALSGALLLHVHAGSMLLGGAALTAGVFSAWTARRVHTPIWFATLAVSAIAVLPLAARVFREPGWPLTYMTAISARHDQRLEQEAGAPFAALGHLVGVPASLVLVALGAGAIAGVVLLVKKRWRAGATLTSVSASILATVLLAPHNQVAAPELMWIGGVSAFLIGMLVSAGVAVLARQSLSASGDLVLGLSLTPLVLLSWGVALPGQITNTAGPPGRYVPEAADAIVAETETIRWVLDEDWMEHSAGILLELHRRGTAYCVIPDSSMSENPDWFFPAHLQCVDAADATVATVAGAGDAKDACTVFRYAPSVREQEQDGAFAFHVRILNVDAC